MWSSMTIQRRRWGSIGVALLAISVQAVLHWTNVVPGNLVYLVPASLLVAFVTIEYVIRRVPIRSMIPPLIPGYRLIANRDNDDDDDDDEEEEEQQDEPPPPGTSEIISEARDEPKSHQDERQQEGATEIEDITAGNLLESPQSQTESSNFRRDSPEIQHRRPQQPQQRIHFLDNLKIFLTGLVVTHHVGCAFGGCGSGAWFLIIGDYPCLFNYVASSFAMLNQSYFMPLFFFVSAYFTPSSYRRYGGHEAFLDKSRRRLYIPALATCLTIVPASSWVGLMAAGQNHSLNSIPLIMAHCWFLFWLLLFNWIYAWIQQSNALTTTPSSSSQLQEEQEYPDDSHTIAAGVVSSFPSWSKRWMWGSLVCGIGMLIISLLVGGVFYGMPVTIGSLTCDVVMFSAGIAAAQNGWLSSNIRDRMQHQSPSLLRFCVVMEAIVLVALFLAFTTQHVTSFAVMGPIFFVIAGIFCLDMALALLELFQTNLNQQPNKISSVLADAAYGVYLIHPLVVTTSTAGFIAIYNHIFADDGPGPIISFDHHDAAKTIIASTSPLLGPANGSLHLGIGFVVVTVVSHLICWPLAWWLRQLPGFRWCL